MKKLTHTDNHGKAVMVDIGEKIVQARIARASGHITLAPETIRLIEENQLKKGDVLTVAQLAGINAAKQTSSLIPLCHNIAIESVSVRMAIDKTGVKAESEVKCTGKTGVEMEALTSVSIALLTIYDMCKAVDKNMILDYTELIEKIKK
ncbi:MAG TPA: cyclic pyranopterin monophosphate synthase MoaC [Bacteroidales bacterium]|nr:cyclic pyranopterin monophosphate synthase MoaC [Bacteroidales bacterium]